MKRTEIWARENIAGKNRIKYNQTARIINECKFITFRHLKWYTQQAQRLGFHIPECDLAILTMLLAEEELQDDYTNPKLIKTTNKITV